MFLSFTKGEEEKQEQVQAFEDGDDGDGDDDGDLKPQNVSVSFCCTTTKTTEPHFSGRRSYLEKFRMGFSRRDNQSFSQFSQPGPQVHVHNLWAIFIHQKVLFCQVTGS